ncbi:arsenate reductase (glutaredoxin) [Noviherbaspirillum denitrificans]|uniref:Arsenate reductase n=1 Tax=Noviherbaspirillum denitrificans TaxID=1968433 RepID=A0A254TDQ7_9BURK|nr:arsenate reductase (glutaredoxin) [Noviherbaspirillum denitrificans]OWW20781.1 arsenate reductase [Noviherbaspirillum denitrificans]
MITIYHNPRCSKSREALSIVEAIATRKGLAVDVVEYLKTPPDVEQLEALRHMLRCKVADMVRSNEEEFATLELAQADDAALLRAVAAHPKLLQRPIVVFGERAVIARPPELASGLLDG